MERNLSDKGIRPFLAKEEGSGLHTLLGTLLWMPFLGLIGARSRTPVSLSEEVSQRRTLASERR